MVHLISSVEGRRGVVAVRGCSVGSRRGAIAVQSQWQWRPSGSQRSVFELRWRPSGSQLTIYRLHKESSNMHLLYGVFNFCLIQSCMQGCESSSFNTTFRLLFALHKPPFSDFGALEGTFFRHFSLSSDFSQMLSHPCLHESSFQI